MKPHVICHMAASLDGRIITSRWGENPNLKAYETTAANFDSQAWLCGRVTFEKDFTDNLQPDLEPGATVPDRHDFIADKAATSFAVAIDGQGKLGWETGHIDDDHIISVLTEQVSNEYLAYLRRQGVSYLFGGVRELDFKLVFDKLGALFPIKTILLEGGGHINGSLLKAGLVDELSLLHYPAIDGAGSSAAVFEQGEQPGPPAQLQLKHVEQLPDNLVWLRYDVVRS
ncbi:RibD family protein [Hymenobacter sp. BT186]|uniref:RibD family protein n=1 Tax=Hymenobacter telluris TaxID=2816474 RepID=A0A939EWJ0_9BACT|nr:RibD family protein [Hymenobacter telluris]MBO0358502.1 RibD family protein [Hymenobacter telluris]MBW3374528.1 RibD family protein [Hymenobacter norwichensis]